MTLNPPTALARLPRLAARAWAAPAAPRPIPQARQQPSVNWLGWMVGLGIGGILLCFILNAATSPSTLAPLSVMAKDSTVTVAHSKGTMAPASTAPTGRNTPAPAAPHRLVVVNTGRLGLNIRRTPDVVDSNVIGAAFDGETLIATGRSTEADGRRWVEVRASNDLVGWVAASYVQRPLDQPGRGTSSRVK